MLLTRSRPSSTVNFRFSTQLGLLLYWSPRLQAKHNFLYIRSSTFAIWWLVVGFGEQVKNITCRYDLRTEQIQVLGCIPNRIEKIFSPNYVQ